MNAPSLGVAIAMLLCSSSLMAADLVVTGLFRDRALVEINGKQEILKVGQIRSDGITLISADSKSAVIEVNGQRTVHHIGSRITSQYSAPAVAGVTLDLAPDEQGMYRTAGTINGYVVDFLVDTGATDIAINRNEARRMGIDYRMDGQQGYASTASGTVRTYSLTLKKVTAGPITLTDVHASVIDSDAPPQVLLGNSFLGRVNLTRAGTLMRLEKKP